MQRPSILVVIVSAGVNPWLEIEIKGQERLIRQNAKVIKDHIWISANPNFSSKAIHRFLIGVAKSQMWHYPDRGRYFFVLRRLLVGLLKRLPIQIAMRTFFLNSGRKQISTLVGNRVELNLPTPVFVQGHRTLRSFKWALQNSDFDYLVRITSNCLINEPALVDFIDTLPKKRVYGGRLVNILGEENLFVSGAALVLSRDVVTDVILHQNKYRFDSYEDVALGSLIKKFDLADWYPMQILDLISISSAESVPLDKVRLSPIIRCKAEDITRTAEPVLKIFEVVEDRFGWAKSEIWRTL